MCYNMITILEVDYENPWIYEGRPFTSDDIGDYYGFVYCITNTTTGQKYIGRKYFVQKRKPKGCLLYTSPSPRDLARSRMPSSA